MDKKGNSRRFFPYIVIAFLSILVYINALDNAFHYDDEHDIVANSFLGKWENIPLLFTSSQFYQDKTISTDHYRPVVYVTYALNKITGGNNPFGYHVVNLAFHIGSVLLLFLIVKAMFENRVSKQAAAASFIAFTAAIIFAVHPFNSEAVNYITARSSIMSGFFYLLAFYCWIKYRKVAGSRRNEAEPCGSNGYKDLPATRYPLPATYYIVSLLAFSLAMLSKESAITLPLALWLYDLYFCEGAGTLSRIPRFLNYRTYLPYLPFVLVVVLPALAVRFLYWEGVVPSFKRSLPVQLYTELPVLVKHLKLFIFPVGLNIDHQTEIYKTFFTWPVAGSALILAVYLLFAFLAGRSKAAEWRVLSFFMIWFFVVLLPTIVIPLNVIFQENRGYLAVIVCTVFAAVAIEKVFSGTLKKYIFVAVIILVFLYGAGTVWRNSVWQDGLSLWSDAAAKSPQSSKAHTNLGTEYARRELNDAAIGSFLTALRLSESDGGAEPSNIHYNLGTVYQQMNRMDIAVKEYMAVIALNHTDFRPWYNLGVIYQQKGELDASMKAYEMVIERNSSHFKSYHNIGLIYHNRGDISRAAEYYRKALSINPDYARSRVNLEAIYRKQMQ